MLSRLGIYRVRRAPPMMMPRGSLVGRVARRLGL